MEGRATGPAGKSIPRAREKTMLLALDMGNSALKCAFFRNGREIAWRERIPRADLDGYRWEALASRLPRGRDRTPALVASVVPSLGAGIARALEATGRFSPRLLEKSEVPCRALVDNPAEVGIDRLLNAAAAAAFHGRPALVLDCGTAFTFDMVGEEGDLEGGVIAPSPETAGLCLAARTAALDCPALHAPASVVGRNTADCLRAGLVLGFADLAAGIIGRISRQWRDDYTLVATGGGIGLLLPHLPGRTVHDPDLTLRGIALSAG